MKTLAQYITEAKSKIKLPHTFDIYNSGAKNVNHKITKSNIYKIFFGIEDDGIEFIDTYDEDIKLPLPASLISYTECPTKANTNNWTEVPEVNEYMYAGAYYSDKWVEYNYDRYNNDWDTWLNSLRPYMSGKVSVTLSEDSQRAKSGRKQLIITVNNPKFNKEREEKINTLIFDEIDAGISGVTAWKVSEKMAVLGKEHREQSPQTDPLRLPKGS